MILECIPYRNTEVGKKYVKKYDRFNRRNPTNNRMYLIGRVERVNSIIRKYINGNR